MGNLGKYLILLGAVGMSGLCSLTNEANANVSGDELYSESIYITKSSAEVPKSLESNARLNDADAELAASVEAPVDPVSAVNPPAKAKKVAKRRNR